MPGRREWIVWERPCFKSLSFQRVIPYVLYFFEKRIPRVLILVMLSEYSAFGEKLLVNRKLEM